MSSKYVNLHLRDIPLDIRSKFMKLLAPYWKEVATLIIGDYHDKADYVVASFPGRASAFALCREAMSQAERSGVLFGSLRELVYGYGGHPGTTVEIVKAFEKICKDQASDLDAVLAEKSPRRAPPPHLPSYKEVIQNSLITPEMTQNLDWKKFIVAIIQRATKENSMDPIQEIISFGKQLGLTEDMMIEEIFASQYPPTNGPTTPFYSATCPSSSLPTRAKPTLVSDIPFAKMEALALDIGSDWRTVAEYLNIRPENVINQSGPTEHSQYCYCLNMLQKDIGNVSTEDLAKALKDAKLGALVKKYGF